MTADDHPARFATPQCSEHPCLPHLHLPQTGESPSVFLLLPSAQLPACFKIAPGRRNGTVVAPTFSVLSGKESAQHLPKLCCNMAPGELFIQLTEEKAEGGQELLRSQT